MTTDEYCERVCNLLAEEHGPSDALQEALEGFADSHRGMFREYVNGWHSDPADILTEWESICWQHKPFMPEITQPPTDTE